MAKQKKDPAYVEKLINASKMKYNPPTGLTPGQLAENMKLEKRLRFLNGEDPEYAPIGLIDRKKDMAEYTELEKRKKSPIKKDKFVDYPAHRDAPKPKMSRPPAEYSNKSRDQLINEILAR